MLDERQKQNKTKTNNNSNTYITLPSFLEGSLDCRLDHTSRSCVLFGYWNCNQNTSSKIEFHVCICKYTNPEIEDSYYHKFLMYLARG